MNETSCYKINGRIFFKHKDVPCKRRVMKTLGVKKNTFAGNMISRVYDYYFQGAINLKKEYRKYYRKEFCSVEKFIEEHFNIELDDAKKYFDAEMKFNIMLADVNKLIGEAVRDVMQ